MDDEEFQYYSSLDKCLVGRVQVDISSLAFSDASRKEVPRIIDRFKCAFEEGYDTSRHNPQNRLQAHIDSTELDDVLRASQLTRDDLQVSFLPGALHPKLNTSGTKIYCFEGRHRLKAAEQFHNTDDCWWTIDLYVFESDHPLRPKFLQKQSEQLKPATPPSDGEVYQKIRHYHRLSEEDAVEAWKLQLSPNKQGKLARLLRHKKLVKAFDMLLPFAGLWDGFQLGNISHHLALHCNEEDLCNLSLIFTTWDAITLGEEAIRQAVNIQTVEKLQLRAPSASTLDYNYINRQMDRPSNRSDLFPAVEDREKRNLIKKALLRLEVMIPTIKTFHHNRRYLGIGANIVKRLLLDNEKPKRSIYKAMCAHWRAPETILEEVREWEFRSVTLERPDVAVRFFIIQVYLAAFRQFPNLSTDDPLKEPTSKKRKRDAEDAVGVISGSVKTAYKNQFLRRAQLFGFRTKKIINGLRAAEDLTVEVPEPFTEDSDGEVKKRRSGTPYTNAYKQFRTQLFLANLRQARAESGLNPSVMFVQRDFINAFFSWMPSGGRDFVPLTALIRLFEPAAPPALPHPVSQYEPEAAAAFGPAVLVGTQVEMQMNNPPRGLVVSPQLTILSEGTLMISPQSSVYTGPSEHWSQFSLPNLDVRNSEGERNGPQDQRERSFAALSDDRRSLATTELRDRDDERRSSPSVDLQDIDILRPASTGYSDRRSFSEPEFRNGDMRADRRSFPGSEPRDEDDERRSFPTVDLQDTNIGSPASTDDSGRRSFPALELPDVETRQRSPARELRDEDDERRSFPSVDLQDMDVLDLRRSFPAGEVQSTSASDLPGRRSFPALEMSDGDVYGGRRSFPMPELGDDTSGRRQTYVTAEAESSLADRGTTRSFTFEEYNGMTRVTKRKDDMKKYLKDGREGWTMMFLRNEVRKTIRFDHIVEHMRRREGEEYCLVARDYVEHFRTNHLHIVRSG